MENIEKKIMNFLTEKNLLLEKEKKLFIIAVSGGSDSMAMLNIFLKFKKDKNINILVCHINHGIRGDEAKRDEDFVEKFCADNDINFIKKQVDSIKYAKEKKLTLEESARTLRYDKLNEVRNSFLNDYEKVFIILCHHMNDNVETIIFNILRGTGINGLKGMSEDRDYYLRPFLSITKNEIKNYIAENNISYVDDSTNEDTNYTRNFIRKNIISDFEKVNDNAIIHINNISNDIKKINEYINKNLNNILNDIVIEENKTELKIDAKKYKRLEKIEQEYLVDKILNKMKIQLKDFTRKHKTDIVKTINGPNKKHLDLPYNVTIDKDNNIVVLTKNKINISMQRRKK